MTLTNERNKQQKRKHTSCLFRGFNAPILHVMSQFKPPGRVSYLAYKVEKVQRGGSGGAALSYSQIGRYLSFEINPIRAAKARGQRGRRGNMKRPERGNEARRTSKCTKCGIIATGDSKPHYHRVARDQMRQRNFSTQATQVSDCFFGRRRGRLIHNLN